MCVCVCLCVSVLLCTKATKEWACIRGGVARVQEIVEPRDECMLCSMRHVGEGAVRADKRSVCTATCFSAMRVVVDFCRGKVDGSKCCLCCIEVDPH